MSTRQTRDQILSQWEHQNYYLHCASGMTYDSFELLDDWLGWRDMGICSFRRHDESGKIYKGPLWKKGMLLFPNRMVTSEEIQVCLGDQRIGKLLAEFSDRLRAEVRDSAGGHSRGEDMLDHSLFSNLQERFEEEYGEHPDAGLIDFDALEKRLNLYISDIQKEWRQKRHR